LYRSFSGITAEGINRELATTLESAAFCRKYASCKSLAIPETAVLKIADTLPPDLNRHSPEQPVSLGSCTEYALASWEVARGILPSLRYIVHRDCNSHTARAKEIESNVMEFDDLPDTHPKKLHNTIDPFGNDYFCKICSHELANTYFHCDGCESLLAKDFNVCTECFNDGSFYVNVEMHQWNKTAMASHFHHLGKPPLKRCSNSLDCMTCSNCRKCLYCNCVCHTKFQKRRRFYTEDRQQAILERCSQLTQGHDIKYATETECRLEGESMSPIQDLLRPTLLETSDTVSEVATMETGCAVDGDKAEQTTTVDIGLPRRGEIVEMVLTETPKETSNVISVPIKVDQFDVSDLSHSGAILKREKKRLEKGWTGAGQTRISDFELVCVKEEVDTVLSKTPVEISDAITAPKNVDVSQRGWTEASQTRISDFELVCVKKEVDTVLSKTCVEIPDAITAPKNVDVSALSRSAEILQRGKERFVEVEYERYCSAKAPRTDVLELSNDTDTVEGTTDVKMDQDMQSPAHGVLNGNRSNDENFAAV
jgi:hypothetical protein